MVKLITIIETDLQAVHEEMDEQSLEIARLKALVGLPIGGSVGQVPAKVDSIDFNVEWTDPPIGPEQPRPTDIQYYADGFIVIFADANVRNYSWVKDGDGQITNITNITPDPDEVLNVGYNAGNRP